MKQHRYIVLDCTDFTNAHKYLSDSPCITKIRLISVAFLLHNPFDPIVRMTTATTFTMPRSRSE